MTTLSRLPLAPALVLAAGGLLTVAGPLGGALHLAVDRQVLLGIASTAALALTSAAVTRSPALRASRDTLSVFAAISVFGWVSTWVTSQPAVHDWLLRTAPVPVAFLLVNSVKLVSVALLAALALSRRWSRDELLLRLGDPRAATGLPGVRWPVLGPVVIAAVMLLFLSALPAALLARVGEVLVWLPVMLLGCLVNAVCEELLYRHAAIGTARKAIGTAAAVALSSVVFGLSHITGNPGGLVGVLATTAYGAVCALAMLQTRGMCWNVAIHVFGDLAIVLSLTLPTTSS